MYWLTGVLGLVLILAPFGFGYSANATALWSSVILGAVVALASGYRAVARGMAIWEYWVAGIAGLLAVVAPFVLGFSAQATALEASIVLGAFVAILSATQVFGRGPRAGQPRAT